MNKEIESLKSMIEFYETLIDANVYMNFTSKSNKYDVKIKEYQDKLSELNKRLQELRNRNI